MTHDSHRIKFLSREIERLKTKLSITEQIRSTTFDSWVQSTKTLLENQIIWDKKKEEFEQLIQQKDEQLDEKQEEIEELQKMIDRMVTWSQEVLACHICGFDYDETRVPKVIRCGHTMCIECIKQLFTEQFLTCPFCRIEHQYAVRQLSATGLPHFPTNFALVEVIEAQPSKSPTFQNSLSLFGSIAHDLLSIVVPATMCYLILKK